MKKQKRAQAEVITTILLILVGIAAVIVVSGFVINMVRNSLKGTDCFETMGQLKINSDTSFTFFNSTNKSLYLNIERETKQFNLTGISVTFGTDYSTKTIKITSGSVDNVKYILSNGTIVDNVEMPDVGETKTYVISVSSYGLTEVNTVIIAPIIINNVQCDKADEKKISSA